MRKITTGNLDNMPEEAASRNSPVSYPWQTMKRGDWFKFESNNLQSCRVRASQMSRQEEKQFQVFVGKHDRGIYCRRVDGLEIQVEHPRNEAGYVIRPMVEAQSGPPPEAAPIVRLGSPAVHPRDGIVEEGAEDEDEV